MAKTQSQLLEHDQKIKTGLQHEHEAILQLAGLMAKTKPDPLESHIGQQKIIKQVKYLIDAAIKTNVHPPHMVFVGCPGLGKSRLVYLIAEYFGATLKEVKGAILQKTGWESVFHEFSEDGHDEEGFIKDRSKVKHQILYLDECEVVKKSTFELGHDIIQPRQDGRRIFYAPNRMNKSMQDELWVPEHTQIWATNFLGELQKNALAALDRCRPNIFTFEFYVQDELVEILWDFNGKEQIRMTEEAAIGIAKRARGTPRNAIGWYRRCNSYRIQQDSDTLTKGIVDEVMDLAEVDCQGLTKEDREYMKRLNTAPGGKMGKNALAATLQMDSKTLELEIEPWLLHQGYIAVVTGGRTLTTDGLSIIKPTSPKQRGRRLANKRN